MMLTSIKCIYITGILLGTIVYNYNVPIILIVYE